MLILGLILFVVGLIVAYTYFENKSKKKSKDPIIIGMVMIIIGGFLLYEEKSKEERIEELNSQRAGTISFKQTGEGIITPATSTHIKHIYTLKCPNHEYGPDYFTYEEPFQDYRPGPYEKCLNCGYQKSTHIGS